MSLTCRDCQRRLRRGRLCPVHFADFLGWLNVLDEQAEQFFWSRSVERDVMIRAYLRDPEDLSSAYADYVASNRKLVAAYKTRAA